MFELEEGRVVVNPDKLALPFFRVIFDADKSKGKEVAFKELSYIFYLCDYKSPYSTYPEDKRSQLIIRDIIKDDKWKPSKDVLYGCLKYRELTETPEMRLLKAWEAKIDEVVVFLGANRINEDNMTAQIKSGTDMEKIVTSVQRLRDIVNKQTAQSTRRGNKATSLLEENG